MTAREPTAVRVTGIVLLLASALSLASPASADQIQVGFVGSTYGPYQTGQGGEFTLNDVNGSPANSWLDLTGYSAKTSNFGPAGITSFQTFCVEENEYIYPYSAIYDVQISSSAVHGGVGGAVNQSDPLSVGTAYLYSQFARGVLDGYNYGPAAADRSPSAAALQQAIWWLEEEITSYTVGNHFIDLVAAQFGSDVNGLANASNGQYGVHVLNLTGVTDAPQGVGQDQLYYAPGFTSAAVPDGGRTLAMLGMALCGMAIVSRRLRRS
jgi:hypothetical protein